MSPLAAITTSPHMGATRAPRLRIFLLETRMEFLRLLRAPAFSVPILALPLMFYLLFGILLSSARHTDAGAARYMLADFLTIGVMAPGLFGVGVTLAMERERGLLELKRALPMPRGLYLAAKLAMAVAFASIVSILLMLTAAVLGHVVLEPLQWGLLFAVALLGVLPFCGLGLLIGALAPGQAAPAVINLIYLPMSFLSGLWVPLRLLPHAITQLAPLWPAYHLAQLALEAMGGAELSGMAGHLLVLLCMAAVFFAIARGRLAHR